MCLISEMGSKLIFYFILPCLLFSPSILKVSAKNCNFNIQLTQKLLSEGFHRNMTYEIVFNSEMDGDTWMYSDCIIGLDQKLPPGVFVNPDQLKDFKRQNKINAIPKKRVNIELPAEESSTTNVFIIGIIRGDKANLWVPVHARYHASRPQGGTARNTILPPKLYLRCPDKRLNECDKSIKPTASFLCHGATKGKCSWKELWFTAMTDTIDWDIPVGNTDHYYIVATGTSLVVIVGSLYLLKTIHDYKMSLKKRL